MDPVAHFSIALAASKLAGPKAPLLVLGAATQIPDLLFFGFQAAGLERKAKTKLDWRKGLKYLSPPLLPCSHGLLMSIVWSLLAAAIAFPFYRDLRTSFVVGLMIFSHWVLDAIVYPNLPLTFEGSREVGLGLITSGPGFIAGIILEVVLIGGGIAIYLLA